MSFRQSSSLCAAHGKVRLDPCRAAHLRRRVATGTDFAETPQEIAPVLDRVKSFVSDALSDGELNPREVADLYGLIAFETQRLTVELEDPETPNGGYLDFMSDRDLELKRRIAASTRRKRLLRAIKILTGLTAAGGLIYALINTSDQTAPLVPDDLWADRVTRSWLGRNAVQDVLP